MRLSTKARYAVRAMIDLAVNGGESGASTRDEIAARQEISPLYLSHILLRLARTGLVISAKGPGGGYHLGKSPAEIRVSDIVHAVGEPISIVPCTDANSPGCRRADQCAARLLWQKVAKAVGDTLESVTLAQLCDEAIRLRQSHERESV
jgi:Rrf2 family protein